MKLLCLIVLIWFSVSIINGQHNFYFITVPNFFLTETAHQLNIHTSTDLKITIETVHIPSQIKFSSPVYFIKKGLKTIPYHVPFIGDHVGRKLRLNFRGDNCSNIVECTSKNVIGNFVNKSYEIGLIDKNYIIFAETDKPIYKPGEKVKLRFMPIYPTNLMRKPKSLDDQLKIILDSDGKYRSVQVVDNKKIQLFDMITIENPDSVRMAQWINVSLQDAMNLEYQLSRDPTYGIWKAKAKLNGQKEIISFNIKKYVLPRFTVDVIPPSEVLANHKVIKFKVCAKYSTGKVMKAKIYGSLCATNYIKNTCVKFEKFLNKKKCDYINVKAKQIMAITENQYYFIGANLMINVTVIENGTTFAVSKVVQAKDVQNTPYQIKFESKPYYKSGLPYYGLLRLLRHSNKPQKRTIVTISVNGWDYNSHWGFSKNFTSRNDGYVEFVIPYIPLEKSINIIVKGIGANLTKPMVYPISYHQLQFWHSVDKNYLQIRPISSLVSCPGDISLTILTNYDVSSVTVYSQIFARGKVTKINEFLPIPVKCEARNDALGHYKCAEEYKIICLPGWTGDNCREPICNKGCISGACVEPDKCVCKDGWTGVKCDQCVLAKDCKHGYCHYGNDCVCYPGWSGFTCAEVGPKIHYYNNRVTPMSTTVKPKVHKKYQSMTIFERMISMPLQKDMGPDLHIIVYFINRNNEVVADSIEISKGLKNCSHLGGGKFAFNRNEAQPKDKVVLTVDPKTKNASCAVRISDIALAQFGKSSNVDLPYLVQKLIELNHKITVDQYRRGQGGCIRLSNSKHRIMPYYNSGMDSRRILALAGLTAITNARIINTKCRDHMYLARGKPMGRQMNIDDNIRVNALFKEQEEADSEVKKDIKKEIKKEIREYFPESWLFSYFNKSVKQINLTTPDSMTTWQANAYCMTEKGLWIAPTRSLKVMVPFFVDIYVPYSMKLNERLKLAVKVFNYAKTCYEIYVKIDTNRTEIEIVGMKSFTLCVCSNDEKTVYFNIRPLVIGKLNITVSAQSKHSKYCSISQVENKNQTQNINIEMQDAIRRQLLVEPPGVPTETTFSQLICNKNEQLGVVDVFTIPTNIVPGSLRSYLKFNGDAMGQTFDNLDKLVQMPYGCGEQNMMAVVPSIYVLQYLTQLKIHNPMLTKKAKEYILHGYTRQLNYKHDDGSFSAFGKSDKAGSTWLTAFVLKSFSDANRYVSIPNSMLLEAIKYLGKMQSNNGCFKENGKLFSSTMAGGAGKQSATDESLLSAYILISLKGVNLTNNAFNISGAVQCVTSEIRANSSNYRLAMSAYVLSIYQPNSKLTNSVIEQLKKRAVMTSKRYKHWSFDQGSSDSLKVKAADIETTGYAFLALQNYDSSSELLKVVYWLSNQRNSLGGYYSTQDTVVALNALAVFAESIGLSDVMNLSVSVTLNEQQNYVDFLNADNRLVSRNIELGSANISYISIKTKGSGCLSIQLISLYNIEKLYADKDTFRLSVKTDVPSKEKCNIRQINICFSYLRRDKNSNMILVTINYPSGWVLSPEEANNIKQQIATPLNRIDFQENTMELYYDAFSYNDANKKVCFQFKLEEKSKIENLKPALVRIMDYYNPDVYTDASYTMLHDKCNETKKKPDIPKVLLCPTCVDHSKESTRRFVEMICGYGFVGFVSRSSNGTKNRALYQPFQAMYYEWNLDLHPKNCSCLKTWTHLNDDFVILSSQWKYLSDNLVLSNDSVMFQMQNVYSAFKYDLFNQCSVAHNFYSMMDRIKPDFSTKVSSNHSCPVCILDFNYYFVIQNLTEWYCSDNGTKWDLSVTSVFPKITGLLSNNQSSTHVEIEFPNNQCFCYDRLVDMKKTFKIIDFDNIAQILINKKVNPIKLLLNNQFEIVEKSVISRNSHIKC